MLGEQRDEDHLPPRAGESLHRAQLQQQQGYVGDLPQRILVGQIRSQQDVEFDQAHASRHIQNGKCPSLMVFHFLLSSFSCFLSLLYSVCVLCDMMESLASGILSSLLETRGSCKGAGSKTKEAPSYCPVSCAHFSKLCCRPSMYPLLC